MNGEEGIPKKMPRCPSAAEYTQKNGFEAVEGSGAAVRGSCVRMICDPSGLAATLGYSKGGATVSVRWRYQNAMADVTSVTTPTNPGVGVPAYNLIDLFGSYSLNDKWQIRAGVTNLADKDSVVSRVARRSGHYVENRSVPDPALALTPAAGMEKHFRP
ncbi:MAG: TonB-dependent receptor [Gammaproteobacteria bacterium]